MATPVVSRDAVLRQLERVKASEAFSGAARSSALLQFLVGHVVEGRLERLKEYTLGCEALGRGSSFDPRTDPIVRAEASRLRRRLEHYYAGEGRHDVVHIQLPKGAYVPRIDARHAEPSPAAAVPRVPERRAERALPGLGWLAMGALAVAAALGLARVPLRNGSPQVEHVVPLTALPGTEVAPTFSPDGSYVAFGWDGDQAADEDIYVKLVGASEVRRLTSGPGTDTVPSWSPDGRRIAFVRFGESPGGCGRVHLVSPLGGQERALADWPAALAPLSWSQDGLGLAVARCPADAGPTQGGISLVPVEGGAPRRLTTAVAGGRDVAPAFSPDGRSLAYAACTSRLSCDVFVQPLGEGTIPAGPPRRVTRQDVYSIHGMAWTPDGRSLVYDAEAGPETFHLWRVAAHGRTAPERIEVAGVGAWLPALSGTRLAFTRWHYDPDIVRFAPGRRRTVFAASSYWDGSSHFSPDGRRVAFESMRSGERQEIWLADADGSDPAQLTRGPGRIQGSPAWSPDGRRIAFDSLGRDGHWDVWTIEPEGGSPSRLTRDPGDENVPRWSHDGRWLYFAATRNGRESLWRVPATGGAEELVLGPEGSGIFVAQESSDGRRLYHARVGRSPLVSRSLADDTEARVADCVSSAIRGFFVAERGVYYAACDGRRDATLRRVDAANGREVALGPLENYRGSITVSPDERTILYTSHTRTGSDLMLVEGFR
jgi:Tol biopolymer transport system component